MKTKEEKLIGATETEESMRTRVANCSKELEDILAKYGCTLQVNQGVSVMPLKPR